MDYKLKIGDKAVILYNHDKYNGQEVVIVDITLKENIFYHDEEEILYEVIFVSDVLRTLYPLREYELQYISSGYESIIHKRNMEIEKLKEIERLKKQANDQPTRT